MTSESWGYLDRRQLLVLAGSGLALAACSAPRAPATEPSYTVDELMAEKPFYIAHRGSQDNWPEHTAEAYRQSIAAGAKAIEVSVHSTADGVLVCHHDPRTFRLTGEDLAINLVTYEDLKPLFNNARPWLGPGSPLVPIPRLKDVLDAHAATRVIFIEDKQGTNTEALLELMNSYPDSQAHFVWKQPVSSNRHTEPAAQGYRTWGYADAEDFQILEDNAADFDVLGIHHSSTDEQIAQALSHGKPVICWEVHTRSMRDRLIAAGVSGLMCSNIPYVMSESATETSDRFGTGLRAAGDLPFALAWTHQPKIQTETSSILLDHPVRTSYCMGSMCPIARETYTLSFDMRWPVKLPQESEHAGIAFGQRDDSVYRVREASTVSGYHLILRRSGVLELFGRKAGTESGYSLGKVETTRPVPGQWMNFTVDVSPNGIMVRRTDGDSSDQWLIATDNKTYRGGYFWLCRNYDGSPPVEFRSVAVKGVAVREFGTA